MDCNIQCCTLVIFVALAATLANSEDILCDHGLKTHGFTQPKGDIYVEYGKSLEIFCSLYPYVNYTSSSLTFYSSGEEVKKEYLSIVNASTLRLYIDKPPISSVMYMCKLITKTDKDKNVAQGVCLNKVFVGLKPQPVKNFSCISHNWNDLNCSWIPPNNYVRTNYNLSYSISNQKVMFSCPNNTENTLSSCCWDGSTTPTYRQAYDYYKFKLNASNQFENHTTWYFTISTFAAVVPDKPRNLSVLSTTVNSISLHWFIPMGLENFPPGLIHKIQYKTVYEDWQDVDTSALCVSKCVKGYTFTLSDLKYANTVYEISVRCRSGKGVEPFRWSEHAAINISTIATLPYAPPNMDISSFEIGSTNSRSIRDVYLYWQEIPKYWKNGDSFEYKIASIEENGIGRTYAPSEITSFYACFRNLSSSEYKFKLVSSNSIGSSLNYSEIVVPAESRRPPVPEQVTQIPFNSGTYELSWKNPLHPSKIDSYTVFWCRNKSDRPYQCSGGLNWTKVSNDVNVKNISLQTESQVYQFGVSTNMGGVSSGIVWASCTLLPGRGGGRMNRINATHIGSTYIYLMWKLECSNQIGVVLGFRIEFCSLNSSCDTPSCYLQESCNNTLNIDGNIREHNITGLNPYTRYIVFVSVNAKMSSGLRSDPLVVQTLEDVPDPIETLDITRVTNTSVSLEWSPPENNNGILRYYLVFWGGEPRKVEGNNSYTLEGLESYKEYNISVSGCTIGCGRPSIAVRVVTLLGHPGSPPSLRLEYINASRVVVSWDRPSSSLGNHTFYTLKFQVWSEEEVKFEMMVNETMTKATLPWDKCDRVSTLYRVSVRAVNVLEGNYLEGPWSEPQQGPCILSTPPPHLTVVIPLVGVLLALVLCIFCALFSQQLWAKFNRMRDIGVKLPARLGTRHEDKSENHTIHIWNNHVPREPANNVYRPSPDEQSLLKVKEEIELIQEDTSGDRESLGCDHFQSSTISESPSTPVAEVDNVVTAAPASSPGYIMISPPASGYVTIPPLAKGYMMATLPPSPNSVSPSLPQCSILSLKQNSLNSFSPKPFNSFPEPSLYADMISPINST